MALGSMLVLPTCANGRRHLSEPARRDRARARSTYSPKATRAPRRRCPTCRASSPIPARRPCRRRHAACGPRRLHQGQRQRRPGQGGDREPAARWRHLQPGNPAYVYNPSGAAGFSQRLEAARRRARHAAGLRSRPRRRVASATVVGFASSSVAWLQESRKMRKRGRRLQERRCSSAPPTRCPRSPASTSTRR